MDEERKLQILYHVALAAVTQAQADSIFEEMIQCVMPALGRSGPFSTLMIRAKCEELLRFNLGYIAADCGNDVRARVELLYKCEHPIFGSLKELGNPEFEESLELGQVNFDRISDGKPLVTLRELRKRRLS